ncbi:MlaD family protein, partial [Bacteroidota bacterium]
MNSSKSKEIKVGVVTIVAVILLIIGITIGNEYSVSVDLVKIKMRFPHSGGIEQTAPLFVNGVKRGRVVSVTPDNGTVLIMADIDNVNDLNEDVNARIGILEITGGKKIEIHPGHSDVIFNSNNEITGTTSPDIGDMVAMFGEMSSDAKSLLKKLDTIAGAATKLLADDNAYERLNKTIENTSEMIAEMHHFVTNNLDDLEVAVKNLKIITSDLKSAIDKYEPRADKMVAKLDLTIDETRKLVKNADQAIMNANKLIDDLSVITEDIRKADGVAGRLIYDK